MYRYDAIDKEFVADRAAEFREQVKRRMAGEITEDQFKPIRLMNGLYLQLHAYMLRIAIPYGALTATKLRKLAYIAIFNLSSPRYVGLHDPLTGPVAAAGAADLKTLMVGGRIVVENGAIPGLDLEKLRRDAAGIIKRIAS